MRELSIDIETYCSVDLLKSGLYKYVQSPDFEILLFAYAVDNRPVTIIDLAQGEQLPQELITALADKNVIKTAYNASFEWYCLNKFWPSPLDQWRCTMAKGLYCGYPAGLAAIGNAIGLAADKKKLASGKALIRKFSLPCKPSRANGGRTRNLPKHEPEQWELFKTYCMQDVTTERELKKILDKIEFPAKEQRLWEIDVLMNAYGVKIDRQLVEGALKIDATRTEELLNEAVSLTGLDNPNSVAQLKEWIEGITGEEISSLNKTEVPEILKNTSDNTVKRALEIRQELSKTSVKKYQAMANAVCGDDRVRGLLQYYGANRTGRYAGRLVQVQNLPRNYLETLNFARELVKNQKIETIKLIYGNVPDTLSQLIRTAFIAPEGQTFAVADFSAIEARVISWLAGEQWRLDVFKTHGKIYEASASQMFGIPIEKIKKGNPEYALRQKGKVAELALGYQGGTGALIQMGALNMGLTEAELPDIVSRWRTSNKRIVDLWKTVQNAIIECIETGRMVCMQKRLFFSIEQGNLAVNLPSGRQLFYVEPRLVPGQYGPQITYMGQNQTSKKWERTPTYGGKLTENIIQAIARDCLAEALIRLVEKGYVCVMHVHDEIIAEVTKYNADMKLQEMIEIMCQVPKWAEGLPLNADGFISDYYKKD